MWTDGSQPLSGFSLLEPALRLILPAFLDTTGPRRETDPTYFNI